MSNETSNETTVENKAETTGSTPNVNGENATTEEKVKRHRTSPRVNMGNEILASILATSKAWTEEKAQTGEEDVNAFRESLSEEQRAAFGRILSNHAAEQALSVLEFISSKVEAAKSVDSYKAPSNELGRLYVGVNAEEDTCEVFRSMAVPTPATHGARYVQVIGSFKHEAGAAFVAKLGRARSKAAGDKADDAIIYSL